MKLSLEQTKFVGLTMKLDLKAQEYKMLCKELEKLKKENIDNNDERLKDLFVQFQKNYDEIVDIKEQLKELNNSRNIEYNNSNIFDKRKSNINGEDVNTSIIEMPKENIFKKIINRIFSFFKRK